MLVLFCHLALSRAISIVNYLIIMSFFNFYQCHFWPFCSFCIFIISLLDWFICIFYECPNNLQILSLILSSIGSFPLLTITVFLIISFLVCYLSILTFPYFPHSFFLYRKSIFLLLAGLLPNIGLLILTDFNGKRISTFRKLKFVKQVHTFYKNFVFLEDFYIQNF